MRHETEPLAMWALTGAGTNALFSMTLHGWKHATHHHRGEDHEMPRIGYGS